MGTTGCESLQKKFVRKSKKPPERSAAILVFEDYSRAMTPLDRYRRHALLFDYWNQDLLDALQRDPINLKRIRRGSAESLAELTVLRDLVDEPTAQRIDALIRQRARIERAIRVPGATAARLSGARDLVEAHARQLHRELSWRDVEDRLKPESE